MAAAQLSPGAGSHWPVPAGLHAPIEQQAVLLRDSAAGRQFLAFLREPAIRDRIGRFGYDTPP